MDQVAHFYDDLADHYHLIFEDWDATLVRQGETIDGLLQELLGPGPRRILDCACGIGTQALGLARLGHEVKGTDLSPAEIARAKREAERLGLQVNFAVADMRVLSGYVSGPFDVVCAFDNALPHLEGPEDLLATLQEAAGVLGPGGLFLASIRDYDCLREERPRSFAPQVIDDAEGRRVTFQVWDWRHDGRGYAFHLYILRQPDADQPPAAEDVHVFTADYWALTRAEVDAALTGAGFGEVRWLEPEASGYYQPVVMGRLGA